MQTLRLAAGLALGLLATAAYAQEAADFTSLTACRLDEARVALRFAFDGGACQEVGEVSAAEPRGTIAAVTIPTHETSEICTMQLVQVEGIAVLDLAQPVSELDVTALRANNEPQAHGVVEIAEASPDCVEPGTAATK